MRQGTPTNTNARRARLDGRPKRSLLLASRESFQKVAQILSAIEPYGAAADVEVVVARAFTDSELAELTLRYPWARLVPAAGDTDYLGLRRAAVKAADGDILEILQDDRIQPDNSYAGTTSAPPARLTLEQKAPSG